MRQKSLDKIKDNRKVIDIYGVMKVILERSQVYLLNFGFGIKGYYLVFGGSSFRINER